MLERRADSPSCWFFEKSSEREERLDRAFVRPRQVRYQAALRPDFSMTYTELPPLLDSKAGVLFLQVEVAKSELAAGGTRRLLMGTYDRGLGILSARCLIPSSH